MEDWRDAIPEGVDRARFERFDDLGSVLKSYAETDAEVSRRVRIPTEDTSAEDRAKFFSRLGAPASAETYPLQETEDQGLKVLMETFRDASHKGNLTVSQFKALNEALVGTYADLNAKRQEFLTSEKQRQADEWVSQVKDKYGDKLDSRVAEAKEAVSRVFSDEHRQFLTDSGLTNHPAMVEMMAERIYPLIADGKIPSGDSGAMDGGRVAELTKIYWDSMAESKEAQAEGGDNSPKFKTAFERAKAAKSALWDAGVKEIPVIKEALI